MNNDSRRGGPRSLLRRGPRAAGAPRSESASRRTEPTRIFPKRAPAPPAAAGRRKSVDDADQRVRNYRQHFTEGLDNEALFRATRSIVTAARRWRKLANERVKVIGQTMARWETLFLVALSGDEMTQGDLARLISVEGPTMVRMLDVLAKDGLIVRRQSSTDRRVTTNRITPKGMRAIRDIMAITDKLRSEVMGNIDAGRLEVFLDVLTQILRNIDEKSDSGMDGKAYPFDESPPSGPNTGRARAGADAG